MKVLVIFLVLLSIATLIPHTFGSGHNQDMGFFYLPLTTESKNHHILAQSTSANFVNAFYDSSLNSLLASISSVNSEYIGAITMTNQTYWELFAIQSHVEAGKAIVSDANELGGEISGASFDFT